MEKSAALSINVPLWAMYYKPLSCLESYSFPKDDRETLENMFQEFPAKPNSLESVGVFNLGASFLGPLAMVGYLKPGGIIDQLEVLPKDREYMTSLLGLDGQVYHGRDVRGNEREIFTPETWIPYDAYIGRIGGKHFRDSLDRAVQSTRAIAGNPLWTPEWQYDAVVGLWVGEAVSGNEFTVEWTWRNMLRYVKSGGVFAITVVLESTPFETPSGVPIPMGVFTEETVNKAFKNMPAVKDHKVLVTSGKNDIRPGYNRVALVVGQVK